MHSVGSFTFQPKCVSEVLVSKVKSVNDQLNSSLRGNWRGLEVFAWFETSLLFIGAFQSRCEAIFVFMGGYTFEIGLESETLLG